MPFAVDQSMALSPAIRRGTVEAVPCLKAGWRATRDQYWHLLALTLSGLVVGSLVPLGLLMGPAMCGIHLCYLAKLDGRRPQSDLLVEGLDFFIPSLVATIWTYLAMVVPMIPLAVYLFVGLYRMLTAGMGVDPGFDPALFAGGGIFLYGLVMLAQINILFFVMFAYLLIVDRGLGGTRAVVTSVKAVWANLGGLVGLFMLSSAIVLAVAVVPFATGWMLLSGLNARILGLLLSLLGSVLSLPPLFGALTVAYRQIFPAQPEI